jgi:hypothetical protein
MKMRNNYFHECMKRSLREKRFCRCFYCKINSIIFLASRFLTILTSIQLLLISSILGIEWSEKFKCRKCWKVSLGFFYYFIKSWDLSWKNIEKHYCTDKHTSNTMFCLLTHSLTCFLLKKVFHINILIKSQSIQIHHKTRQKKNIVSLFFSIYCVSERVFENQQPREKKTDKQLPLKSKLTSRQQH